MVGIICNQRSWINVTTFVKMSIEYQTCNKTVHDILLKINIIGTRSHGAWVSQSFCICKFCDLVAQYLATMHPYSFVFKMALTMNKPLESLGSCVLTCVRYLQWVNSIVVSPQFVVFIVFLALACQELNFEMKR